VKITFKTVPSRLRAGTPRNAISILSAELDKLGRRALLEGSNLFVSSISWVRGVAGTRVLPSDPRTRLVGVFVGGDRLVLLSSSFRVVRSVKGASLDFTHNLNMMSAGAFERLRTAALEGTVEPEQMAETVRAEYRAWEGRYDLFLTALAGVRNRVRHIVKEGTEEIQRSVARETIKEVMNG